MYGNQGTYPGAAVGGHAAGVGRGGAAAGGGTRLRRSGYTGDRGGRRGDPWGDVPPVRRQGRAVPRGRGGGRTRRGAAAGCGGRAFRSREPRRGDPRGDRAVAGHLRG